jgi:hypothetical protein
MISVLVNRKFTDLSAAPRDKIAAHAVIAIAAMGCAFGKRAGGWTDAAERLPPTLISQKPPPNPTV